MRVWIRIISHPPLTFTFWRFFFFLLLCTLFGRQRLLFMNSSRRLLTFQPSFISYVSPVDSARDPQTSIFSNFFIKNWFHGIIHTFNNYFATVFSVFNFNKINSIQTDLNRRKKKRPFTQYWLINLVIQHAKRSKKWALKTLSGIWIPSLFRCFLSWITTKMSYSSTCNPWQPLI